MMKMHYEKGITLIALLAMMMRVTCTATIVQDAYELRLSGNADAALAMLEKAVSCEPDNAAAWYEIARTQGHLMLGNPRTMMERMKEMQAAAEKAATLEPDNLIYAIYKAESLGLDVYMSLKQNSLDTTEKVQEVLDAYGHVLQLKSDYNEAKLSLVEYLKNLPTEKGGDLVAAEAYTQELENADVVLGAQAREMMLPEDADLVAFWKKVLENNPDNADVLDRLGKAYFYADKPDQGIECLHQAIQLDAGKNTLHLDIARYYMYQAMRDGEKLKKLAPKMDEAFSAFINSKPTPVNPMLAYAKGWQGRIKSRAGDKSGGRNLRDEANALDPNHSKATGLPDQNLYIPPDQVPHGFSYFTRPF